MQKYLNKIINTLIGAEIGIHLLVALMLIMATAGIFIQSIKDFGSFSYPAILNLISNALLMLIVKEVLWTVIKFLKKRTFSISSFLFIGVISGIRQILFTEVQKSLGKGHGYELILEIGVNAIVIFILVGAYYLLKKADQIDSYNKKDFDA